MRIDRARLPRLHRAAVVIVTTALLLAACTSDGQDTAGEATGPTASGGDSVAVPAEPVRTFEGETVSFEDYRGTPMVVNFWASWCAPCVAEMPDLEAVHQAAGDRVAFVGINTQDTPEEASDLVEQTGVTYHLITDPSGDLFRQFEVFGMPATFYVNADGQIVDRHTGLLTRQALVDDLAEELGVDVRTEP